MRILPSPDSVRRSRGLLSQRGFGVGLGVGLGLFIASVALGQETNPNEEREQRYQRLQQAGILRTGKPSARYGQALGLKKIGGEERVLISESALPLHYGFKIGDRVTVVYGKGPRASDHQARVLELDKSGKRARVRALERTDKGLRKTERWLNIYELGATAHEVWPSGTRVFAGPAHEDQHVTVVDRRNDPHLDGFLKTSVAPLKQRMGKDYLALVDTVAGLVRGKLDYNLDADAKVGNKEVLLGDYLFSRTGVCRNYAALTKVALDSLKIKGLRTRYVAGTAWDAQGFKRGGHAWIEVTLPNGRRYGVDPTWIDPPSEHVPLGKVSYSDKFVTLGTGGLAPIGQFYQNGLHVPSYQWRTFKFIGKNRKAPNPAATDEEKAPPRLLTEELKPEVTEKITEFTGKPRTQFRPGEVNPHDLKVGRPLVWRFDANPTAIDTQARILEIDEAGGRAKIKSLVRVQKVETLNGEVLRDRTRSVRKEHWVPLDAVKTALAMTLPGTQVILPSGKLIGTNSSQDPGLKRFLSEEIAPIGLSSISVQKKIARAIGRVRARLGSKELDPDASFATLGEALGKSKLAEKPFAALGVAALYGLGLKGINVRYVLGARMDKDLVMHSNDAWLELKYADGDKVKRVVIDPRTGRIDKTDRFYLTQRYAPVYGVGQD